MFVEFVGGKRQFPRRNIQRSTHISHQNMLATQKKCPQPHRPRDAIKSTPRIKKALKVHYIRIKFYLCRTKRKASLRNQAQDMLRTYIMLKFLKTIFHPDHFIVSAATLLLLWLLLWLISAVKFLDPVEKIIMSLSTTDIYYRINASGELNDSQDITLIDITDLSARQRDSLAIVVEDVLRQKPAVTGVDIIFEGEQIDAEGDAALVDVFYEAAADSSVIIATKLNHPDSAKIFHGDAHSFFVGHLGDRQITEGCVNVLGRAEESITRYPVFLSTPQGVIQSLPALMTRAVTGHDVPADRWGQHAINYKSIRFPVIDYREIETHAELIRGHKVLIGATREERDSHLTPIGTRSGLEVIAFALNSMVEGDHVWWGGAWASALIALFAGYAMNLIHYSLVRPLRRKKTIWLRFFADSTLYGKILALLWIILFTGITYMLYTHFHIYKDTWLALGVIVLLGEGRLFYTALLTAAYRTWGEKALTHTLYVNDIRKQYN